jgi:hypothetical protein
LFWPENKIFMKKIIITYGLIGGVIVSVFMVANHSLVETGVIGIDRGMITGYTSMVIALSMVFFGIKTYRDQYLNGIISFGRAFKIGILITAMASLMYAITWEVYYNSGNQDFMEVYSRHQIDKMVKEGATNAEVMAASDEMKSFSEMYKNPLIRFGMTLAEILPVGIVVTLLCAALLRRRQFLPA